VDTNKQILKTNIFERSLYRKILSPIYENKENLRIITGTELYAVVKKPTITKTIRLHRLRWFGHVEGMVENRIPQTVLYCV
jgi:hypothetical protein